MRYGCVRAKNADGNGEETAPLLIQVKASFSLGWLSRASEESTMKRVDADPNTKALLCPVLKSRNSIRWN